MRLSRLIVLTAGLLLVNTQSWAASTNLYTNGGFEQDGAGWTLYLYNSGTATGTVSYPATGAQEGSKFCRVTVTKVSVNSGDNWLIQLQDPMWTAKNGTEYHLSFWAKADAPHTIQIAAKGDAADSNLYRAGTEISVGTTWKQYEMYRKADVAGAGQMNFSFFCGYATGTYDFDNMVLTEYTTTLPTTMTIPAQGAWQSGVHRNLFAELGYSQTDIDSKVNAAFQQLFFGDRNSEAVYTAVGSDLGYINTPNSGSIITEGQSYGMIIAVMMDRQDVFNKLWKFAKSYMQHQTGDRKGYFSWKVNEASPYTMVDPNPAPDGEEYFVTSLLLAAKRWSVGTGIFNYQAQADSILAEMAHKAPNASVLTMIDTAHAMITFSPVTGWNPTVTDASYHLPGFYEIWSQYATTDKVYWARMADSSRAFFKRSCHATTGLMSDLQNWDGTPYISSSFPTSKYYKSDAWRTPMNIGFDYGWFKADSWEVDQCVCLMKFFDAQGDYKQRYSIDGQLVPEDDGTSYYSASGGQIACNAVSTLACNDPVGWKFVNAFWKMSTPSGTWRYYSGLLHMLGLLHCSGKFKIYGNPYVGVVEQPVKPAPAVSSIIASGMIEIIDLSGQVVARYNAGAGKTFRVRNNAISLNLDGMRLSKGVYFAKMSAPAGSLVKRAVVVR